MKITDDMLDRAEEALDHDPAISERTRVRKVLEAGLAVADEWTVDDARQVWERRITIAYHREPPAGYATEAELLHAALVECFPRRPAERLELVPAEPQPDAPTDIAALPDYWDERRMKQGKPDLSRCAAELRVALAQDGANDPSLAKMLGDAHERIEELERRLYTAHKQIETMVSTNDELQEQLERTANELDHTTQIKNASFKECAGLAARIRELGGEP